MADPTHLSAPLADPRPSLPHPPRRGVQVLVVDDDPGCLRLLSAMLTEEGFEVATVTDGAEALHRMTTEPPDVLITDLEMPGIDGFELLRAVRPCLPETVVVVISGNHHGAATVFDNGALAFLGKPIQLDELLSVLDAGLQLRHDPWLQPPR